MQTPGLFGHTPRERPRRPGVDLRRTRMSSPPARPPSTTLLFPSNKKAFQTLTAAEGSAKGGDAPHQKPSTFCRGEAAGVSEEYHVAVRRGGRTHDYRTQKSVSSNRATHAHGGTRPDNDRLVPPECAARPRIYGQDERAHPVPGAADGPRRLRGRPAQLAWVRERAIPVRRGGDERRRRSRVH